LHVRLRESAASDAWRDDRALDSRNGRDRS
jgi:hypothetical protein